MFSCTSTAAGPFWDSSALQMLTVCFIIQAELALASDETPVGCVFVHDGKVIARGMNGTNVTMNVSVFSGTRLTSWRLHPNTPYIHINAIHHVTEPWLPVCCDHNLTFLFAPGNTPCRIRGHEPDLGRAPALDSPRDGSVRDRRTLHHVRLCLAPIPHSRRLFRLPQRPLWWLWWSHAHL